MSSFKNTSSEKSLISKKSSIILGSLHLGNTKLKSYIEDEDKHHIVVSIREEIIEKALDEIYSKYIDSQTINFVVHCACNALKKIVDLYFYHHDHGQPYYESHPVWTPDVAPEPSLPDSWAPHPIPIGPKVEILEVDLPEFQPFDDETWEETKSKLQSDEKNDEEIIEKWEESTLESNDTHSITLLDSVQNVEAKKHPSLASLFTSIKTGPQVFIPKLIAHSKMKWKVSKKQLAVAVPDKICPVKKGIPPLRVEPTFKDEPVEDPAPVKKRNLWSPENK